MSLDVLKMGDYGAYVWSSYGLTFVVLLWLAFVMRHRNVRELKNAQRRAQVATVEATNATSEARRT